MAKDSDFNAAGNGSNLQAAGGGANANPIRGGKPLTPDLHDSRGPGSATGEDAADAPDRVEGAAAERGQVGPGCPPRDTRWKKGGPSPNPRGRPRKDQTMRPDLKKWFERAIDKKMTVPRGERTVLMNRIEIGLEQLLNQFAKGDRHARRDLMDYADKLGVDLLAKGNQAIEQALTPNHQAILDTYLARRLGTMSVKPADPAPATPESGSAPRKSAVMQRKPAVEPLESVTTSRDTAVAPSTPAQQERVFAPPELLDDDVVEDSPTAPEAAPLPAAEVTPEIQLPTPVDGMVYHKRIDLMTASELRAWFPKWYAQNGEAWSKQQLEKARRESLRPPPGRRPVQ